MKSGLLLHCVQGPMYSVTRIYGIECHHSITLWYDTFGPLDQATFGGTGIPNDEVAISSQFSNGSLRSLLR